MDLGWFQAKVAAEIGVTEITICNWETQRAEPAISHLPAIISFLGYTPYRVPGSFGEWLAQCRRSRGLSQEALAKAVKKDEGTIASWERGDRQPIQKSRMTVKGFFFLSPPQTEQAMNGPGPGLKNASNHEECETVTSRSLNLRKE